ncbi:uncharacterized protein KY384_001169 [Bacidia gigantensis]|uniref:uncharacterized protein n=1 Tax=Bacidia gigantensis TaxID=2732470 RepID=UPI001D0587AF|nr:uncharacterized protein KY384_001169 [Bacidia gigantensis]KAG8534325.1 hypothetical protein KY384_001169 [Bacidia gigantensis]
MALQQVVFPGEDIPRDILPIPSKKKHALKIGAGLQHIPPDRVTSTVAGNLGIDTRKNAVWVNNDGGRYIPQSGDLIIATVHSSAAEIYQCAITPHTTFAQLPQLAFEGATKKTRPHLVHGSLIYARVNSASKFIDPDLVCYNPATGKSEGLGELKDGMVFSVSLGLAKRLLVAKQEQQGGIVLLDELAERVAFEVAIGRNGKVWIKSSTVKETLIVGNALRQMDEKGLGIDDQRKLVKKLLKSV